MAFTRESSAGSLSFPSFEFHHSDLDEDIDTEFEGGRRTSLLPADPNNNPDQLDLAPMNRARMDIFDLLEAFKSLPPLRASQPQAAQMPFGPAALQLALMNPYFNPLISQSCGLQVEPKPLAQDAIFTRRNVCLPPLVMPTYPPMMLPDGPRFPGMAAVAPPPGRLKLTSLSHHEANLFRQRVNTMTLIGQFGETGRLKLESPHGVCLGGDGEIVIADTGNHRIQVYNHAGELLLVFGKPGKTSGLLWYPRKVAVLRNNGCFVICDRGPGRSRLQIFDCRGMFVQDMDITFVHIVAGMCLTADDGIVAIVDSVRPTVFFIDPHQRAVVKYFECSDVLTEPSDIAVNADGISFVTDFKAHCICVFSLEGKCLRKISTSLVPGISGNISLYPNGIDISGDGDLVVGDSHGSHFHVAVFNKRGKFLSHYKCPAVKASRCCGIKVAQDGRILTAAKTNHVVLVFDSLFTYDI